MREFIRTFIEFWGGLIGEVWDIFNEMANCAINWILYGDDNHSDGHGTPTDNGNPHNNAK